MNPEFALKVLHTSLNGLYVHDLKTGTNTFINAQYTRLTGYPLEQLNAMQGRDFPSLFHPQDRDRLAAHMARLSSMDDSDTAEIEYRFRRSDGQWIWCQSRDSVFERDPDGSVRCIIGTFLDITERKQAEENLRQSEGRYRELVQNANSAIIRWNCNGHITFFNDYAQSLFGYRAEEVVGRHVSNIVPEQETTGRDLTVLINDIVAHPERYKENVNENVCRDGRRIWMLWTNRPIIDEQGKVVEIIAIGNDITKLKAAEAALHEADRRKNEFLATLAHELRNPLAPLQNAVDILRLSAGNRVLQERAQEIMERQIGHLVRLVDDLLDISRITRGAVELRKERVNLAEVIRSAVQTVTCTTEARRSRVSMSLPAKSLVVEVDPIRATQILVNLLNNAVKYGGEDGAIWIRAGREGEYATVSVRDNGCGIAPEVLPKVFELFTRADSAPSDGLGIGLALVRSLVHMHGGSIEARSEGLGYGAEFIVRLPLAEDHSGERTYSQDQTPTVSFRGCVLVVDDDRDAADGLGKLLEMFGAEVHVVYDGPAALKAFESRRPAAVFLDIRMPGMDGCEVVQRMREHNPDSALTLIAVTGFGLGQEADRRWVQDAGCQYHLTKPVMLDALENVLLALGGVRDTRQNSTSASIR